MREHVKQIQVTIAVAGRVRDDDLDPLAREDLMDLYRRWRDDPRRLTGGLAGRAGQSGQVADVASQTRSRSGIPSIRTGSG